ncbi:MAG: uracil phosphoribosyltransferase [Monoraphidium minutum]|nr:MAG: uracil phosphoribosyltransferase [Monoraphidium minutum]
MQSLRMPGSRVMGQTRRSRSQAFSSVRRRPSVVVRAAEPKPPKQQMLVYVPPHPLVKHWLAIARNATTPPALFRSACSELGRVLIYEAVREFLPTVETTVDTPMGTADVEFVDPTKPIKVVPILRAGLILLEQAGTVLPLSETYHVGYVRNEETLQATPYLNKLPQRMSPDDLILVADPMLATGGTMLQVLADLVSRGADPANIRIVCIVAAPPALKALADNYPGLRVYSAIIDAELNDKGYIIPGLGDAGDRAFGTAG